MARVMKSQFLNQTEGWLGAVALTSRGEEKGIAIEPRGTVWLSEDEQELTAGAPRDPKDNPFIPQVHVRTDPETGALEEYSITPLVPHEENRFVPARERPIPADLADSRGQALAQAAATGSTPEHLVVQPPTADKLQQGDEPQEEPQGDTTPPTAPPAAPNVEGTSSARPPSAPPAPPAPAPPAPAPEAERLGGEGAPDGPVPNPFDPVATPGPATPTEESETVTPQPPADPAPPATPPGALEEERAVESPGPVSEEIGSAFSPLGEQTEGEYAQHEEVGTPDAPAADAPTDASETADAPPSQE